MKSAVPVLRDGKAGTRALCAAFVTAAVNQNTSKLFLPSASPTNKTSLLLFPHCSTHQAPLFYMSHWPFTTEENGFAFQQYFYFPFDLGFKRTEHENF